jgi:Rrf2 family protein
MEMDEHVNSFVNAVQVSEATSLALHAAILVAANHPAYTSTIFISERLDASKDHLSKVLQRLVKSDILASVRGPKGGFILSRPAAEIKLLEVYEAMEGRQKPKNCLLGKKECILETCAFGGWISSVNAQLYKILSSKTLADFQQK